MNKAWMERLERELGEWRTRFDEARVKGGLVKLEFRDLQDEFRRQYWRTKGRLDVLRESGAEEWTAGREALEKGWEELRRVYQEARDRQRSERRS